jgi:putative acetyltransferase
MMIRDESADDSAAVHSLNVAAFATPAEADLVLVLRQDARPLVSLVAEEDGTIVGHIMFTRVELSGHPDRRMMGLGPMAVAPEHQRRGIGSQLVRTGLERCRVLGYGAVVVLGHPEYYPRFGFTPSSGFKIGCEYDVSPEDFMVVELQRNYLYGASGTVKYHPAFAGV